MTWERETGDAAALHQELYLTLAQSKLRRYGCYIDEFLVHRGESPSCRAVVQIRPASVLWNLRWSQFCCQGVSAGEHLHVKGRFLPSPDGDFRGQHVKLAGAVALACRCRSCRPI